MKSARKNKSLYWESAEARLHSGPCNDTKYDKLADEFFKYLTQYQNSDGLRVLDIGAGDGSLTLKLYSMLPKSIFFGCDNSERLVSAARSNAPKILFQRADFLSRLPYCDNYFDLVISSGAIQYVPPHLLRHFFSESTRVLKRGGDAYHLGLCDKSKFFYWYKNPLRGMNYFVAFFGEPLWSYLSGRLWKDGSRWHHPNMVRDCAFGLFESVTLEPAAANYRSNVILRRKV